MADDLVLGRWIIRNIACRHGCVATFTPKIEEGVAGNGLHVHLELLRDNGNIMTGTDGRLSGQTRKIMHKDLHTHQGVRSPQVSRARA